MELKLARPSRADVTELLADLVERYERNNILAIVFLTGAQIDQLLRERAGS